MDNKKSKVVIFIFLILIILIPIFLLVDSRITGSNSEVKDEREDLMIKENPTIKEASQEQITEMAKETIKKYEDLIPYQESSIGAMPYLLAELDLATKDELDELVNGTYDTDTYIKTNVSYDDFRLALLKYMTGELFDEKYSHYKDIDGYVGVQNVAAGFIPTSVQKIELIFSDNDEYTFRVTIRDDEVYNHYLNGEEFSESDYLFDITVKCKYYTDYFGETEGMVVVSAYDVEEDYDENPARTERMKNVTLEVKKESITRNSLELVITDPNNPQFGWGPSFKIQEKVDDNWINLEPKKKLEFTEIGYRMDENHQFTETIDFGKYYNLNKNSIYRVVKPVYAGGYVDFYSNEFTLKSR